MSKENAARIAYCIRISGTLVLQTPLLIGAGDTSGNSQLDMHVLKDKNEEPFIPGTSLAGVLRSLVSQWENPAAADFLFGHTEDKTGQALQSAICINDVELKNAQITVRDGVSIDPYTQIAKKGAKYDYEVVERGASGPFELLVTLRQQVVDDLPNWQMLVQRIAGQLVSGIRIGALTAKGLGRVVLTKAKMATYDFTNFADVQAWLCHQEPATQKEISGKDILPADAFSIDASFALKTSLLVRSGDVEQEKAATEGGKNTEITIPLKSGSDYLIPGTTVKGVLRHQAAYILGILDKPSGVLDTLMGYAKDKKNGQQQLGQKSRFLTDEVYIKPEEVNEAKQTRNAIDRFTGSTMDSKLFAEKPLWQKNKKIPTVHIHYTIEKCQDWEAGLALFLLKDLWTGHVALGGDKAVGRGYLQGLSATIRYQQKEGLKEWQLTKNGQVTKGDAKTLEAYAAALQNL